MDTRNVWGIWPDGMKTCSKCGETKPLGRFGLKRGRPKSRCKDCDAAYARAQYAQGKATENHSVKNEKSRERYAQIKAERTETDHLERWCIRCEQMKIRADFDINVTGKDGLYTFCRKCKNKRDRERNAENPERNRDYKLRHRFGIGIEEYQRKFDQQGGRCAICETREPGGSAKWFHVDHDHETGMIRGLLCSNCNTGIGMLGDDASRLRAAAAYLDSWATANLNVA